MRAKHRPAWRIRRPSPSVGALACDLLTWTQMLALTGTPARRWEPKRIRLRLFSTAGKIVRGGLRLRLAAQWPWASQSTAGLSRLASLAPG